MRAFSTLAAASLIALFAAGAAAQQAGSAGQGTGGFSMTPPIPGYNDSAAPAATPAPRTTASSAPAPATSPAPAPTVSAQASPDSGSGATSRVPAFTQPSFPSAAAGAPAPVTQNRTAPMAQAPQTPQPPAPAAPAPSTSAPNTSAPNTGIDLPGEPGAPAPSAAPFQMVPGQPAPVITPIPSANTAPSAPARPDRYIIPQPRMIFAGEVASRAWVVFLNADEASREATFLLSFINSVVVMPETSRIRVTINGQAIIETPIASSQEPSSFSTPIQRGILRAGANLVRIDVVQRHRTDCTVTATYELWTEINNEGTGISFSGGRPPLTGGLDDLPSVGFDETGVTSIRVITPGPIEGGGSTRVLRAVQGLAVRGQFPNPSVTMAEGVQGPTPPGGLTIVIGTASELPRLMATHLAEASQRPITSFVQDDRLGGPTLVISGPTPADVDRAIDRLNSFSIDQSEAINTQTRWSPNAPIFDGARNVRLAELGVTTQEFSGRRLRAEFQIALPPDFFAEAYGNATLFIDAAFTAAVRPGSHIDLYVNQQIASTLPITTRGGGLLQHQAMFVPLRNFRAGINRLWLEVVLDTESDARCLPGATLPADNRFVLFDSSEFSIGNFARIGRMPDLAAFTANAFPYYLDGSPIAVVLARQDASTLSAASTLIARLALSKGTPLPIDASPASVTLGERNAIFVGGIDHISASVLNQVGVAESTRANWVVSAGDEAAGDSASESYDNVLERFRSRRAGETPAIPTEQPREHNTPEIYERWRENVQSRGGIYAIIDSFESWLRSTFSIGFDSLRIQEGPRTMYEPPPRTSILMAQGSSTNGNGAWTLVTARTSDALAGTMARFTSDPVWNRIGGQAVAFQNSTGEVERRDAGAFRFIVTQPLSFSNFRMIAANWLSTNIMPYALMLLIAGTLLGICTAFLLRRLGRPT
ncbi:cellulose biosynthesis cyclic di-GMP-binding regulatory protein BcsB [Ancylobacter sp. MQZ15Z-1]|uniref:Cyclic di-GMP-binding protein n=1 Tax=Ancylobacter mangrovi TaxID=2972472 RepID=A0A9X2PNU8_9HYPH|nr:cellulose biosynthesis cyclic di-GMP-binding regulatory protein BcsB [Ancylobacter mangrovi]MCS0497128.1 cellulose biosynthesis cyclic di-GMP-binding regulatory protein BcsB [Ancylobacter mangrovi]